MKLLNYTSRYFILLLLPILAIWATLFYYAMLDEIYDSLDDGLENQKILLLQRVREDPQILTQNDVKFNFHIYNFTMISYTSFQNFKESYRDTLLYMQNENNLEPMRVYESAIVHEDKFYKLKIITSMVEEDDLIEHLVAYLCGLYILLIISIFSINNILLKKIWKPFYSLINQLRNFRIEKTTDIQTPQTAIEEFNLLNSTVKKLINKSRNSYIAQKQFIENASHELQTPLAISINKLELFLENNQLNEHQLNDIATVLDNLGKLTRMNKSLLLVSKIENQQFLKEQWVDFNHLTKMLVKDFEDLATHKKIIIKTIFNTELSFKINEDLAVILLTNLIKNALIHGNKKETVEIEINSRHWSINNTGDPAELDSKSVFTRFKNGGNHKKSTGLGLAIAKAICDKYELKLSYFFDGSHTFNIHFPTINTKN